jgi:hypothetical protein
MVFSTALLFISVTTATFVIKESRMSIRMDDSSRAYAAAESGIEWGKYCLENIDNCAGTYGPFYVGNSQYLVTITDDNKIESLGTSSGVNRKLEHIVSQSNSLDAPDPLRDISVTGSYIQQFDFWLGIGNNGQIGVKSGDGTQAIYFEYSNDGTARLVAEGTKNGDTTLKSTGFVSFPGYGPGSIVDPYALRVRIEYSKDLSAKMTLAKKNFSGTGPDYECISPLMVLDLRNIGINYADFSKFYYTNPPSVSTAGDGFSYKFAGGGYYNQNVYFDNMRTSGIGQGAAPVDYTLGITVQNINWGRVTDSSSILDCGNGRIKCSISIPENTSITLSAVGQNGHTFKEWSDAWCEDKTSTTCIIPGNKVTADINLTAIFK